MSDSNISKNDESQIIQEHLDLISGNVLLCSNDSTVIDSLSDKNLQVLSNTNTILSDHIENLLLTDKLHENLLKYDQKFDTIIINDLLEQINHPELFLNHLVSILNEKGTILCNISNFFHMTNLINLLTGIPRNKFFNTIQFYDLNTFLLFLNKNDAHVIKLFRIKKEFSSKQTNLDEILIPSKLIDMFQNVPDSDTIQYVFVISKGKNVSTENLEFISQFPKNYLLPQLQDFFEKLSELEQGIIDKDKIILGLEDSIREQKSFTESAIQEQKSFTESAIQEQKSFTESALSKKDTIIQGHENSIKEQATLIQGHENSIKEQQEYIKNLEEHIRSMESELKKFKFWKR